VLATSRRLEPVGSWLCREGLLGRCGLGVILAGLILVPVSAGWSYCRADGLPAVVLGTEWVSGQASGFTGQEICVGCAIAALVTESCNATCPCCPDQFAVDTCGALSADPVGELVSDFHVGACNFPRCWWSLSWPVSVRFRLHRCYLFTEIVGLWARLGWTEPSETRSYQGV